MSDTIFALSSGFGKAGVAVVRVSGPAVQSLMLRLRGRIPLPRQAILTVLRHPDTQMLLDQALMLWFVAPASFTGEDVVEFHLHGGRAVVSTFLQILGEFPDLRLAEPGEFTRRAFAAGKLDLAQAEALADLIDAETEAQRRQALRGMEGGISAQTERWRSLLIDALALAEAEIDFPDEEDVPLHVSRQALAAIEQVLQETQDVLQDKRRGERLRSGAIIVIAGPPNAGKSTFLNRLAQRSVAMVSATPGTTRDALEVPLDLDGYPVTLIDTAGLRETADALEGQGIQIAQERLAQADLVLWMQDGSEDNQDKIPEFSAPFWRVINKGDLIDSAAQRFSVSKAKPSFIISAADGAGIQELLGDLIDWVRNEFEIGSPPVITRARHREKISAVHQALQHIIDSQPYQPAELVAEDLRAALQALGQLSGRVNADDVLDRIFSSFCIGK